MEMEQRKLIQHGLSSLTVALPRKWLNERGLVKGDVVYIDIEGNKLILGTKEPLKFEKITVDISDLDRSSILLYIQSLYRFGYNEVELKFDNPMTMYYRHNKKVSIYSVVNLIVNRLIGFEIIEQKKNRILLRYIAKEAEEDLTLLLRRIFLLLEETADSLLEGIKNNDMNIIKTIDEKHDNISRFVIYSLRLLNKYGHPDIRKSYSYFHIIASMDKIADVLKYNARDMIKAHIKKKFSEETIKIWERINKQIPLYYQLFYGFKEDRLVELSRNRDLIKNSLIDERSKIPGDELAFLTSMEQILEIIVDLVDFRMSVE
jgi:phosphate uptake regulator